MHVLFLALIVVNMMSTQALGYIRGACGDRPLPPDRVRRMSNLRLECASGVDHFFRRPIPMDKERMRAWREAEIANDRSKMQEIRREQIKWTGSIPYETIEKWNWVDWVYGAHPSCGYDRVCTTSTDSQGKETETCHDVMRSCWHDEPRSEARHCSNETINYDSEFLLEAAWNPSNPSYLDIIPNKWDLLPGESEDVQIFSNQGDSTTITPFLDVGNKWNEYEGYATIRETGSSQAQCRLNQTLNMSVKIHTKNRIVRQTPNAFQLPVDQFGRPVSPLKWVDVPGKDGGFVQNAEPIELRLTDSSTAMIASLARQSRKFTESYERAKQEAGLGSNTSEEQNDEMRKQMNEGGGFWKNTHVRLVLYEPRKLLRDVRVTHFTYFTGQDFDVSFDDQFRLPLQANEPQRDLFRASAAAFGFNFDRIAENFAIKLKPNRKYQILVAMYQKGVPFYSQTCEDRKGRFDRWGCKMQGEGAYFSKDLPIEFQTPANYDARSFLQKLFNWQGSPLWEKWKW
ncbi:MAG: hypothetical protein IT289_13290 [Oligoflexia bacterium]|nr:hypothetical protein [Oligoflexia bacterium]